MRPRRPTLYSALPSAWWKLSLGSFLGGPKRSTHFYPRDAPLARYLLSSPVRPSVRLSVRHKPALYQTANRRITQTMPHDAKKTLRNSDGTTPTGEPNANTVRKNLTPYRWKFVSIRHSGPRARRWAGGVIRGVINKFGGSRSWIITVTV